MLARSFRLSKKDLTRLYQKGKKIKQGDLLVRFILNRLDHPRFAVVISKKIAPLAVDRNRLKRLTYTYLAKYQNQKIYSDIAITYQKNLAENDISPVIDRALADFKEK